MNGRLFGIQYKDGSFEKLSGKNIMEAYAKNGKKTPDGNLDFSKMDFFFEVPQPIAVEEPVECGFQLFLMETRKSQWNPVGKITTNFAALDGLLYRKVKKEAYFSGIIVDMSTEKLVDWLWK